MRAVLASFLLALGVTAQQAEPPKTARIEGTVRSIAGEIIARATVRLEGAGTSLSLLTNREGKFILDQIPPGRDYRLSAERTGFVTGRYGARTLTGDGTPLTLEPGTVLRDVAIEMTPQGVISGRVTNAEGDPIANAGVSALRPSYFRGQRRPEVVADEVSTNDQGEYRLAGLPPGRYYLSVTDHNDALQAPEGADADQTPPSNIPTYYPNAVELRSAATLNVAAGAELRGIDIRMHAARTFAVRGRIVSAGAPVAGMSLSILPKDFSASLVSFNLKGTQKDGVFDFQGLQPGTYVIQSGGWSFFGRAEAPKLVARLEVTIVDKDLKDIQVPAAPGATVTGLLRLEGGDIRSLTTGPAQANSPKGEGDGDLEVTLIDAGNFAGFPQHSMTWADGTFRIENVSPSRYFVHVSDLPDGVYVKSARMAGQDVLRAPADLTSGGGGAFDIVLSSKAADITGIVRNESGEVRSGTTVALWPSTPDGGQEEQGIQITTSDQNGGFRFRRLAPGDYYVAAWEDVDPALLGSHEFLTLFNTSATEVKLAEGSHQALEAKLIPADKIRAAAARLP